MARWLKVPGRMESAGVESYDDEVGERVYQAKVRYSYMIDGRQHYGDRFYRVPRRYEGPDSVEKDLRRFPVGGSVTVHVKSTDPGESYLVGEFNIFTAMILFIFGVIVLVVTFMMLGSIFPVLLGA